MRIFSKYTWRFSISKKEIYLTFDDGPTPEITTFVLNELKKHNAKATFFCIGKNISTHPEIFKQIIKEDHSVGNHTQNHLNGWKNKTQDYIKNTLEVERILQLSNFKTLKLNLFRPPYGKIKQKQAKYLLSKGYKIIMWSVLSGDFDTNLSKEKCLQNVLKNTSNGSIVVFHDSVKAAEKVKYVLPKVLEYFSKRGFEFKAID
jgi:peptidoglycan/xylan/chitin deacetylase (PgdA/CDA1 family)